MAYSTESLKSCWISTQKTARAAPHWLLLMVAKISEGVSLKEVLSECIDMIAKLCKRAHPERDFKDGLYQFGVIFLVDI
jgi:hypothetical protein